MVVTTPEKLGLKPISDPPADKQRLRVSRREVRRFLREKDLPITKKTRRRARNRLKRQKKRDTLPRGRDISIAQTDAPHQVIYGECIVGGIITFINETNSRQWLNHIITLSGHEIQSVESLYLDGNLITFLSAFSTTGQWSTGGTKPNGNSIDYTNKAHVAVNLGSDSQAALSGAIDQNPGYWTSSHRQRGCAHVWMILSWDPELFGEGQPEISFKVKGKQVYDPRSSSTAYSNNAALVIADFLTDSKHGLGVDSALIDYTSVEAAADVCDEAVALNGGGTEKRYTIDGYFNSDESKEQILEEMVEAMAGHLFFSDGKWKLFAGEYRTPTISLGDDDLRGVVELESLVPKSENYNSVRGKFVSSENTFKVTEFPAIAPSAYINADDGRQVWADFDFPFTTSGTRAQRLANIELNRIRKPYRLSAPFSLKAYELEPGDIVSLTLSRFGLSAESFEVVDSQVVFDESLAMTVDLVLEQTGSDVYDWDETSDEGTVNVPTPLDLPDPTSVDAPTGLTLESGTAQLYLRGDGTVASRLKVSWTASTVDPFVEQGGEIEIQFKRSSSGSWEDWTPVPGEQTATYITDVEDGEDYDVRIRGENALGFHSSWTTVSNHTVVGKTEAPNDVGSVSATVEESGIRISWTAVSDLDLKEYEIRFGGSNWATATVIDTTNALTYLWEFPVSGSYSIRVKAKDSSGNYSSSDATTTLSITAPSRVTSLTSQVIDNNVLLRWDEPVTHTLAIGEYIVKRGSTFNTSIDVVRASGEFATIFEALSNTYTYWVIPVDVGGNEGTHRSIQATVQEPPDFRLQTSVDVTSWDTIAGVEELQSETWAGPSREESFEDHFAEQGWTNISDAGASFDYWFQPAAQHGYVEKVVDLGATVYNAIVSFAYEAHRPVSSTPVTPTIGVSDDNVTFTLNEGQSQIYVSEGRYIKIRLDFGQPPDEVAGQAIGMLGVTYAGGEAAEDFTEFYVEVSGVSLRVNVRTKVDGGTGTANAGDSGGTTISLNKTFADLESVDVTAKGSSDYIGVTDWVDSANPTEFSVYFFDRGTGARVTTDFSWTATGV